MPSDETLIPLSEVAASVPGGPAMSTVWRWVTAGVNGVRLEHRRIGGRILSSHAAAERFLAQLDALHGNAPAPAAPALVD